MISGLTWLSRYRGIIKGLVFAAAIGAAYLGAVYWFNSKLNDAYQEGVSATELKWERILDQQQKQADKIKMGHAEEVKNLEKSLSDLQDKLNMAEKAGKEKQIIYLQSPEGKKSTLPDQLIDIYNESINQEDR